MMDDMPDRPSYHDLHVTTADIPRTSIFNLPFGIEVTCTRVTGWILADTERSVELASEYGDKWLILDVAGHVILDNRDQVARFLEERDAAEKEASGT
jgi:hypothetical protein